MRKLLLLVTLIIGIRGYTYSQNSRKAIPTYFAPIHINYTKSILDVDSEVKQLIYIAANRIGILNLGLKYRLPEIYRDIPTKNILLISSLNYEEMTSLGAYVFKFNPEDNLMVFTSTYLVYKIPNKEITTSDTNFIKLVVRELAVLEKNWLTDEFPELDQIMDATVTLEEYESFFMVYHTIIFYINAETRLKLWGRMD
jgi:hypothetical protein